MCMCVCAWCACAWCVCAHGVCVCVVCVCMVCARMVCVCVRGVCVHGCVCVHVVCALVCVCAHGVHGVCVCTWCVRVHGVCVHVWCVCSWCAHVCGCVCVQRERHPVTLANTAHTWARAVMSHPGHRMWSVVTRLRPRGLCGRVCGEAVSTGPSEVTWLVAVGKQKSLDPQEKGARVHCIVASPVL